MKKKIFTLLLTMTLVLGAAGSASAAEKAGNSCAVQDALWKTLMKYFDKIEVQHPSAPETPNSPEQPELPEQENENEVKPPVQNGGSYASQVTNLVNQERRNAGLETLKSDSELTRLAQLKAEDMAEKGYFSHTSPTYGSAFDMLKSAGYAYRTAGENIAMGQKTADAVMKGWMNSSGHRANILESGYSRIGVGYAVNAKGTPYWVQIFAG